MNQILDHSGPKKQKINRNPKDTARIIKVYAILIMIFAVCIIGKAAFSLSENKKINKQGTPQAPSKATEIILTGKDDILTINVKSVEKSIESVSYQWYRGDNTLQEIKTYQEEHPAKTETDQNENDDEEINIDEDEITALGEIETQKSTKGDEPQREVTLTNIGIPKGDSTIYVSVKVRGIDQAIEYCEHYYTEVGVDKIKPKVGVVIQGTKLMVTAVDETEIDYITYSINGSTEEQFSDRVDKKTIKTEIDLQDTLNAEVIICAVDKSKNTRKYQQEIEIYIGKPKLDIVAEPDSSKIYVSAKYDRGIKQIVYDLNGTVTEKEYNPEEDKEVELEILTDVGYNLLKIWVYAEEEQVYEYFEGECEYNP